MSHVIFVKKSENNHVQLFYICMSNYSTSVFLDCQAFIVKYFIIVRILRQTSQKGWESVGEGILGSKKRKRPITKYIEKGSKVLSTLEPFSIYTLS